MQQAARPGSRHIPPAECARGSEGGNVLVGNHIPLCRYTTIRASVFNNIASGAVYIIESFNNYNIDRSLINIGFPPLQDELWLILGAKTEGSTLLVRMHRTYSSTIPRACLC